MDELVPTPQLRWVRRCALDEVFGRDVLHYGATHESEGLAPLRIAFTRIPDESEI